MKNKFTTIGDITQIHLTSKTYGEKVTIISTSKLELVKKFPNKWRVAKKGKGFYVVSNLPGKEGKMFLHRLVTDVPNGLYVDHIDHDGLNNTDENLRIVTNAENQQNRLGPTTRSTSGVLGVTWNKRMNKWRARVTVNNEQILIGFFDDLDMAKTASIEARSRMLPFFNQV